MEGHLRPIGHCSFHLPRISDGIWNHDEVTIPFYPLDMSIAWFSHRKATGMDLPQALVLEVLYFSQFLKTSNNKQLFPIFKIKKTKFYGIWACYFTKFFLWPLDDLKWRQSNDVYLLYLSRLFFPDKVCCLWLTFIFSWKRCRDIGGKIPKKRFFISTSFEFSFNFSFNVFEKFFLLRTVSRSFSSWKRRVKHGKSVKKEDLFQWSVMLD